MSTIAPGVIFGAGEMKVWGLMELNICWGKAMRSSHVLVRNASEGDWRITYPWDNCQGESRKVLEVATKFKFEDWKGEKGNFVKRKHI